MKPDPAALRDTPRLFRASPARGVTKDAVERDGGIYGAGMIHQAAIVTRGEALGHGVWLDEEFLRQTAAGINASAKGVKSRFTHPGLSADGLGSFLGRAMNANVDGDVVRADIHFAKTAHATPDGDLAGYVMDRAEEDPTTFGTSIVYQPDYGAEDLHYSEHVDEDGDFCSPDPDNAKNLPHARLAELRAADVVDEPAANPHGLFHRQDIAHEADALIAYAVGIGPAPDQCRAFDVAPDRIKSFVSRFLTAHGLQISPTKDPTMSDDAKPAEPEATPTPAADAATDATPPEAPPVDDSATDPETGNATEQQAAADPRSECRRFVAAFGAVNGAQWFADGLTYAQAQDKHVAALQAENEQLRQRLASLNLGEQEPAKFVSGEPGAGSTAAPKAAGLTDGQARYAAGLRKVGRN